MGPSYLSLCYFQHDPIAKLVGRDDVQICGIAYDVIEVMRRPNGVMHAVLLPEAEREVASVDRGRPPHDPAEATPN